MFLVSFLSNASAIVIALVLFFGITLIYLLGARVGNYQKRKNPDAKAEGPGPLEGSLLGLLALILSFTFNMSASRHEARRRVIIEEANNISSAFRQADLYPDSIRSAFKSDFRLYIEARIAYFNAGTSAENIKKALLDATTISDRIWQRASAYSRGSTMTHPHNVMLPALNNMIDIVTSRDAARRARVPESIIWLLIILSLLGSAIVGYSKKEKKSDWIVLTVYSLMTVITIYTILDLDRPRGGFIKSGVEHQKIIELKDLF